MTRAGAPVHFRDLSPVRDDGLSTYLVHSDLDGSGLEESILVHAGGPPSRREVGPGRQEVLYVLSGEGELVIDGTTRQVGPDTAALAGAGSYLLRATSGPLEVVAVSGRVAPEVACGGTRAVIPLDDRDERRPAVSNREYQVLFDPGSGCSGMTQFVGFVPAVRTPRHIHPYSEMLCIVRGTGTVEIEGQEQKVGPGWCYYLPEGTVHLVQNLEAEFLVELGVFTPAGSPAQNTPVE